MGRKPRGYSSQKKGLLGSLPSPPPLFEKEIVMKVIKITLNGGMELFVPFDELNKFNAHLADIQDLEGIEMSEKDYGKVPVSNQSNIFFKQVLKGSQ